MQKFRDMMEARGDTAVFTFGRLNPPTIGHGKLIDAMAKQQSKNSGSKMHIFVSHSQDAKKNPLSYNKKVAYIRKMFPKYAKNVLTSKARTIFEVAVALHDK
jgi:nicotinamide mononucleotide adenylyltransferase